MRIDLTNIHINLYRLLPLAAILWPAGNAIADHAIAPLFNPNPQSSAMATESATGYVEPGDEIAGYEVTSGYDLERVHPVHGVVTPHYGVDVATPVDPWPRYV